MNQTAISVRSISKCYRLGTIGRHTLVDEAKYLWYKLRGRDPHEYFSQVGFSATEARKVDAGQRGNKEFWALKNVSFDVAPGEVVGVIGRNGAGKSTLLKILTRITEPTSGEAFIEGRVASLLEVGTGFHPELTGRENVYMNGTILGMKRREIAAKFDEIVAFSELEKFIDTPVKRYSSGMYVRLAFAVAAHLEPEILLIDEVLAVGDGQFQKKCLGKMQEISGHGRTIMFVSHNMGAISRMCSSTMLISDGSVSQFGPTKDVLEVYYQSMIQDRQGDGDREFDGDIGFVRWSLNGFSEPKHECFVGDAVTFSFFLCVKKKAKNVYFGVALSTTDDHLIWANTSEDCDDGYVDLEPGQYEVEFALPSLPLRSGSYRLIVSANTIMGNCDIWHVDPSFSVLSKSRSSLSPRWQGMIDLESHFSINKAHEKNSKSNN